MRYGRTSRAEALKAGNAFYFTGERCEAGHRAERFTATGTCVECERLASAKVNAKAAQERFTRHAEVAAVATRDRKTRRLQLARRATVAATERDRAAARRAEDEQPSNRDVGEPLSCAQVQQRKAKSTNPFDGAVGCRWLRPHFDYEEAEELSDAMN